MANLVTFILGEDSMSRISEEKKQQERLLGFKCKGEQNCEVITM